jgi:hypothetical protein
MINLCMHKRADERKAVGILSVKELSLSICDFERILKSNALWVEIHKDSSADDAISYAERTMVDVFSIGRSDSVCRAIDVRMEENNGDTSSYAFAADFADGIIESNVESLSTVVLLIADAFLSVCPTLYTHARATCDASDECSNNQQPFKDEMYVSRIDKTSALEWCSTMAAKQPIDVLLVRLGMKNFQILISDEKQSDDRIALELIDSEMVLSSFSTRSHNMPILLDRFARGRRKWSSFVKERCGVYHELKSRQCIQFRKSERDIGTRKSDENFVLRAFDFLYTCYKGKVELSTSDDFAVGCTEPLINCFLAVHSLFRRTKGELRRIKNALHSAFNERNCSSTQSEILYCSANPIYFACVATESALASLKNLSLLMKDKINSLRMATQAFKVETDDQIATLRMHLLLKENERLRTHVLVSSEATGWLRVGKADRSGLRGPFASTLWNQWVVLRRSALFIFAYPGQVCIYLLN